MGVTADKIREFEEKKMTCSLWAVKKAVQKQHDRGKLTARERVDLLFDKNTFQETQLFVKHQSTLFGMDKKISRPMVLSPVSVKLMVVPFLWPPRILPVPVGALAKCMQKRYGKSWIWQWMPESLLSL